MTASPPAARRLGGALSALLATLGLIAAVAPSAASADKPARILAVEIDAAAGQRVAVDVDVALPAEPGRLVEVAVEVFRREDRRAGGGELSVERQLRSARTGARGTVRSFRFRLSRQTSAMLVRRGIFDEDQRFAQRHQGTTARELVTVHVRNQHDGDRDGELNRLHVTGADGWLGGGGTATASGTGAVLSVANRLGEPVAVATTPLNCMFDKGEEGSNLYELNGTLEARGVASAYIEGNANLFETGISAPAAYSIVASWMKQNRVKFGLAETITVMITDKLTDALGPVGWAMKSCAFSPSMFGVIAVGKSSGAWAAAVYEMKTGDPRVRQMLARDSGGAVHLGPASAGFRTTIGVE